MSKLEKTHIYNQHFFDKFILTTSLLCAQLQNEIIRPLSKSITAVYKHPVAYNSWLQNDCEVNLQENYASKILIKVLIGSIVDCSQILIMCYHCYWCILLEALVNTLTYSVAGNIIINHNLIDLMFVWIIWNKKLLLKLSNV